MVNKINNKIMLLKALDDMPEETFDWFVITLVRINGFTDDSRDSVRAVRIAANVYLKGLEK
jgi:hypothetical protein